MLLMLLLLTQSPEGETPPSALALRGHPTASMRSIGLPTPLCSNRVTLAEYSTTPGGGLMWREGDEPVRLYRLLERRVNGCSAPIVVMERVAGSSALGRESGRESPRPAARP